MSGYTLLTLLTFLILLIATGLENTAWFKNRPDLLKPSLGLSGLGLGLILLNLLWQGAKSAHLPPFGPTQAYLVLTTLILSLFFWLKWKNPKPLALNGFMIAIGSLYLSLALYHSYQSGSNLIKISLEPLWLWGVIARWLILSGLASLSGFTAVAGSRWLAYALAESPRLKNIQPHTPSPAILSRLFISYMTPTLAIGSFLVLGRNWWGWGDGRVTQDLWLVALILTLSAILWLQFASPQRYRPVWLITFITFGLSLIIPGVIG